MLYKSEFQEIIFHSETSTLENIWFPTTQKMTNEDYKHEMLELSKLFLKYKPEKQLINTQELLFPINPELQAWTDKNILEPHSKEVNLKQVALIVSKELIASLGVEQAFDEEHGNAFNLQYFASKEEAMAWLKIG